jgi:PiT family inorganic phosphate transporter
MQELTYAVVALALAFDFVNGFHDAANAIATIVATKVLTPVQAVAMSGVGNFTGMFLGTILGVQIAHTIGTGILNTGVINSGTGVYLILAVLIGSIGWDIITWLLGLPTSSSHALVGGLVGAGLAAAGTGAILGPDPGALMNFTLISLAGGLTVMLIVIAIESRDKRGNVKRMALFGFMGGWAIVAAMAGWYYQKELHGLTLSVLFMVVSPLVGLGMAFLLTAITLAFCRRSKPCIVNPYFKNLQLVSSFFYSVMHGTSDAQKVIGIITVLLLFEGFIPTFAPPFWVIFCCFAAISLGTFFGGWRIVKTVTSKITKLLPYQGFCANTSGGIVLFTNAIFGIPVSTTHVISSAIMGVGATKRLSAVRWGVARNVIYAWIITIPAAAIISYIAFGIIRMAGLA